MPLFSVIIPTYNRRELLQQTLRSVLEQTFTDYEVIVVDDGSSDGTMDYLRSLGSRLQIIQQGNRGPGAARNLGIKAVTGNYVAFLDSDDVWFSWSLATYAELIQQLDSPAFIAGNPFRFQSDGQLASVTAAAMTYERYADYLASGDKWRWWGVSSFVIRTDVLCSAGGFAEANMNGEDADLAMKLGTARSFVQLTSPFTFGYREHGGNVTADLAKSLAGTWHKIRAEQADFFPGGSARKRERWQILTRHVRPVTLDCLRHARHPDAWALYRATFRWHVALGRWKFLIGFPLLAVATFARRARSSATPISTHFA